MIWNPLKKKQDAGSEAAKAPEQAASQVSEDDRTDPLIGAGKIEERVRRITEDDTHVQLDLVELWDNGKLHDRFMRLDFKFDEQQVASLRQMILDAPEEVSGFRDLLFSPSDRLLAKLDYPEVFLIDVAGHVSTGKIYLRPQDVLAGLAAISRLLCGVRDSTGLILNETCPRRIALVNDPSPIAGHCHWRFIFFGWDAFGHDDEQRSATELVKVFASQLEQLADAVGTRSPIRFTDSVRDTASALRDLAVRPGLTYDQVESFASKLPLGTGIHGATDVGQRREHNEDAYIREQLDLHSATGARLTLAAVADGMGGHASGEVASSLTLALLRQQLSMALLAPTTRAVDISQLKPQLESIIPAIDRALTERAQMDPALEGMGTTLVGYCSLEQQSTLGGASERESAVFWVGDSRAYLLGPCGMVPLSRDHSYVQDLLDAGSISEEEARTHQMKNVITRCLGGAGNAGIPDVVPFSPGPGEAILLCSDGLTDAIDDAQIWDVVREHAGAGWDAVIQALIDAANAAGGPDNITVVIVEFRAHG